MGEDKLDAPPKPIVIGSAVLGTCNINHGFCSTQKGRTQWLECVGSDES